MKNIMMVVGILVSGTVFADDFDITMNVLEADESFDDAIVNRIALPFASDADAAADVRALVNSASQLEELESLVDERLGSSGIDGSGAVPEIDGVDVDSARPIPVVGSVRPR